MGPVVRRAEDEDADVILAFMRQYYSFDEIPFEEIAARGALRRLIRDESLGAVWLICEGGAPVGYIALTLGFSLEYHGRDAFVDEFFIQASHRGRGWGTATLRHVEDAARKLGVRAVHLEVTPANTRALQLYRGLGFADHDRYLMTKYI